MTQKNNRVSFYLRILFSIICGLFLVLRKIKFNSEFFFFDNFLNYSLYIIYSIVILFHISLDKKEYLKNKKTLNFSSTIINVIFVIILVSLNFNSTKQENTSNIITASNSNSGQFGCTIELKKDKTFHFCSSGGIGGVISRGNYSLKDSILILDKNKLDNISVSKKWVIRKDTKFNRTYLIQIDKKGELINEKFKFEVISDKRKFK